jgi:hypothetical protein
MWYNSRQKKEQGMSIMIDLPPAMAQEAQEYVTVRGTTLERLFLDYLKAELKRRRELDSAMSEFDALVEKTSSRRDAPYKFNRADAYQEVMA